MKITEIWGNILLVVSLLFFVGSAGVAQQPTIARAVSITPASNQVDSALRSGLGIVVKLDPFSEAWGIDGSQLDQVARAAAKSVGWYIERSAGLVLSVNVSTFRQKGDDLYTFQLDVQAGSSLLGTDADRKHNPAVGEISMREFVDAPKDDTTRLPAAVRQSVALVAARLKKEFVDRQQVPSGR